MADDMTGDERDESLRKLFDALIKRRQNIAAGWLEYSTRCAPAGLTEREFYNARILFFAGAHFMWSKILEWSQEADDGKLQERDAQDILTDIYNELLEHKLETDARALDDGPVAGNA